MTYKQLMELQKAGKIKGFSSNSRPPAQRHKFNVAPKKDFGSEQKEWLFYEIGKWCNDHALILNTEFKFDKNGRQWRFDYCIPALKCGIEYEGLAHFGNKSGHTTNHGFSKDTEKYTAAASAGYLVLRFTHKNYKNVLFHLEQVYKLRKPCG